MKYTLSVLVCLLLVTTAQTAEKKTPASEFKTKIRTEMKKLEQQEAMIKVKEKKMELTRRERALTQEEECYKKRHENINAGLSSPRSLAQRIRFRVLRLTKMILGLTFLGTLALILVNILLTILVFKDMKKRDDFNGLWIPIILISGMVSIIGYALFRNSDMKKPE